MKGYLYCVASLVTSTGLRKRPLGFLKGCFLRFCDKFVTKYRQTRGITHEDRTLNFGHLVNRIFLSIIFYKQLKVEKNRKTSANP